MADVTFDLVFTRTLLLTMLRGIKNDKWRHFFVGIGLGLLLEWGAVRFFPEWHWNSSFVVFGFIVAICYGFEIASLVLKKGHYDVMDAVAGIIGGVIGMASIIITVSTIS